MKGEVGGGTVYLLGAGASKAVHKEMPLISEFFNNEGPGEKASKQLAFTGLLEALRDNHGFDTQKIRDGLIHIETLLSSVRAKEGPFGPTASLLLDFIVFRIGGVFTINDQILGKENLYDSFCKLIRDNDVVLSLNYDVLLDAALQRTRKWNPRSGYGIDFRHEVDARDEAHPLQQAPPSFIQYLKLHGSLNWLQTKAGFPDQVFLDPELFPTPGYKPFRDRRISGSLTEPLIVPPSAGKQIDERLRPAWEVARKGLEKAQRLVVIGCKVREADKQLRDVLLRCSLGWNPRTSVGLHVVNWSEEDSCKTANSLIELSDKKLKGEQCPLDFCRYVDWRLAELGSARG